MAATAFVVFPRLPSARRGLVFWEDIRAHADIESYLRAGASLTEADVEREYAAQNYFVSDVLHRKHLWTRRGITLFLLGVGAGLTAFLMN